MESQQAQHNPSLFSAPDEEPHFKKLSPLPPVGREQDMKALNGRVMDTATRAKMRP